MDTSGFHPARYPVPLFEVNRWLLTGLCCLAVDNLLYAGGKRGLYIGIFCTIHTDGRRLNWHPHVTVTGGGFDEYGQVVYQYAERAAEELRQERQYCKHVSLFVRTSPSANEPHYGYNPNQTLMLATQDTRVIVAAVMKTLDHT